MSEEQQFQLNTTVTLSGIGEVQLHFQGTLDHINSELQKVKDFYRPILSEYGDEKPQPVKSPKKK